MYQMAQHHVMSCVISRHGGMGTEWEYLHAEYCTCWVPSQDLVSPKYSCTNLYDAQRTHIHTSTHRPRKSQNSREKAQTRDTVDINGPFTKSPSSYMMSFVSYIMWMYVFMYVYVCIYVGIIGRYGHMIEHTHVCVMFALDLTVHFRGLLLTMANNRLTISTRPCGVFSLPTTCSCVTAIAVASQTNFESMTKVTALGAPSFFWCSGANDLISLAFESQLYSRTDT